MFSEKKPALQLFSVKRYIAGLLKKKPMSDFTHGKLEVSTTLLRTSENKYRPLSDFGLVWKALVAVLAEFGAVF